MSNHEDQPRSIPPLRDIGEDMSDEQKARKTQSPQQGYPAGQTAPQDGLSGNEGQVNADATPDVADDAVHGQTQAPAPTNDPGLSPDEETTRDD